ncbi:MAG: hypothetical protein M1833_000222 [Piccolia ochrophora]|nr:MAG: hypothetical protein M1833_000222 [Piccolia ochrophora]
MSATPPTEGATAHRHRGRRLRQLLHPDGRKIHIALSPEEAEALKRQLSDTPNNEPFDLYIQGSPEHLQALRDIHSHQEQKRAALREKHSDVYDEFENVRLELDALSSELHMLTDHGVSLDASFSKYGYSAHLRTRTEPGSSNNSMHDALSEKHDWEAERQNARPLVFFKRPVMRQYFHKGLLWRASETEEVAFFELFVDLLYVGIIAINGDTASEHPTGESLLRFVITFIMSWKIWSDLTLIVSWFETDDIFQRICVLFTIVCLFGFTTNTVEAFDESYTQMVSFYLAVRIFSAVYFFWLAFVLPLIRSTLIGNIVVVLISSALWIGSIHVERPDRYALIFVAIAIDLFGATLMITTTRFSDKVSKRLAARMEKLFEFYPGLNIEHKTERTNAFVALVFGYSVVALLYQNSASVGLNAFFGKAVLGLITAFSFNWLYFEIDGCDLYSHAIRFIWISIHLPFVLCYILGSAGLSRMVLIHDTANADPHDFNEVYEGIISMTHVHKDMAGARFKKKHRLTIRFAVSIIIICLGTADHLNSLELISTVTGLVIFILCVDLWGASTPLDRSLSKKLHARYTAQCSVGKRDLENAVKTGQTIKIEEIARNEKGEQGAFELS